jgi:hypothetical protein
VRKLTRNLDMNDDGFSVVSVGRIYQEVPRVHVICRRIVICRRCFLLKLTGIRNLLTCTLYEMRSMVRVENIV